MTARDSDPDFPESQPELFPQCMTGARTLRPLRFRILREAQLTTRGRGLTDAPNFRVARHSSGTIAAPQYRLTPSVELDDQCPFEIAVDRE